MKKILASIAVAALAVVAACTPVQRTTPAPNTLAWFELATGSPTNAEAFYSSMFGWRFADGSDGVRVISNNNKFVGNLIPQASAANISQWVPVLSVANVPSDVKRIGSLGGRVLSGPEKTDTGTFAVIRDAAGADVILYDGTGGVRLNDTASSGDWIWADLMTGKVTIASRFYKSLVGFDTRTETSSDGQKYKVFSSNGKDRGGLVYVSRSQIEPNWLPYVYVDDLDAAINKAASLGARLLEKDTGVAILIDPVGAAIGIADRSSVE